MSMGDWFILLQIGNNIDSHIYAELIQQVCIFKLIFLTFNACFLQIAKSFKKTYDQEDEAFTNVWIYMKEN